MCAGCLTRGNAHMAPGANSLMSVKYAREAIQSVTATAEVAPRLLGVGSLVAVLDETVFSGTCITVMDQWSVMCYDHAIEFMDIVL